MKDSVNQLVMHGMNLAILEAAAKTAGATSNLPPYKKFEPLALVPMGLIRRTIRETVDFQLIEAADVSER